jgi:hypothetical protein
MMKKYYLVLILVVSLQFSIHGQSGMSLYHLQNSTIQGNHFNPAFIPEGKLFLGLPVLSGVAFDYNSRNSYNDIIVKENGKKLWNTENFTSLLKNRNYVSVEAEISTFYLGIRANQTTAYSLFVNDKIGARTFYSKDIVQLVLKGNSSFIGRELDLSKVAADARYYREIGLGYWKDFPDQKFTIGVRLKYLIGFFNASSSNNFDGKMTISEDNFNTNFDFSNATFNTSGVDLFSDGSSAAISSHLIGNSNTGFGIDLGANLHINKQLSMALAINDVGFINWKVDPKNYNVQDTTFDYRGITLKDVDNFQQTLENSISDKFVSNETANAYKTSLNSRIYASMTFQIDPKSKITGSIANHGVLGRLRMLYAVGYTRSFGKVFTVSGNLIKSPQHGVDIGIGYTVDLGLVQFYLATDKLIGLRDATSISALDLRFGINFIIGKKDKGDGKMALQKPREIYEKTGFREI